MIQRVATPSPSLKAVTVGLFHMKNRYSCWRSQGTQDWLMIYTLGGKGRFGYTKGEYIAERGDLVLIAPGTLHDYGLEPMLKRWDLLWAHFLPRNEWMAWLKWPEIAPGLKRLTLEDSEARTKILERFRDVYRLAQSSHQRRESFAMNALEETLLWCDLVNPLSKESRLDPRIQRAANYICEHFAEDLSVSKMAGHCGLSSSRFAHLFREQMGNTPQNFLEMQRLTKARQLLELSQLSIAEIAYQTGFRNPFYFSLRFKQHNRGVSPRAYRQK
jgi:AraC family transcriptional regulator, arabinose operon regulatory protein